MSNVYCQSKRKTVHARENIIQFVFLRLLFTKTAIMSIELQLKNPILDKIEQINVQFIPATIEENIAANVSNYFNNYTEEVNGGIFFLLPY